MRSIILAISLLVLLITTNACNTVRGMGRDVETVGEATQDAATGAQRRLR